MIETDTAATAANPSSGQTVATDEPVVVDKSDVPIVLSYWGWNAAEQAVQVGGYATGIVESDGTCILTLYRAAVEVTVRTSANPDASSTSCGEVSVPVGQLTSGVWQAVLRYESARSSGVAAPVEIEVVL